MFVFILRLELFKKIEIWISVASFFFSFDTTFLFSYSSFAPWELLSPPFFSFFLSGNHIFQGQAAGIAINENGRGMITGVSVDLLHCLIQMNTQIDKWLLCVSPLMYTDNN